MHDESPKLLHDILEHGRSIESMTHSLDEAAFATDVVMQKAVHWDFAIIGEAMARLRDLDLQTAQRITQWHRIIAFRNQLLHGYDVIRVTITWKVVKVHLPLLVQEVTALLAEWPPTQPGASGAEHEL